MKKKFFVIAVLLIASILSSSAYSAEVKSVHNYEGQFSDISSSAWYYENVVLSYELGLISGKTEDRFAPDGYIKISEAIKLSVLTHQLLTEGEIDESVFSSGSKWYSGYLSYAFKNGIVTEEYPDYEDYASRAQIAILFSRAITSSGLEIKQINSAAFGELSDVKSEIWYAGAVYRMYNWGIITGDGELIHPENDVRRSEVAAILARIFYPTKRVAIDGVNPYGEDVSIVEKPSDTETEADSGSAEDDVQNEDSSSASAEFEPIELYKGSSEAHSFTGITGFAAEFSSSDGEWTENGSYSLELVNNIVLEGDNISFRLYKGVGYEALGIVRGWLNDAAVGHNGIKIREIDDTYGDLSELFYLFIDGKRQAVDQLWYADHGDYTTYAFYFKGGIEVSDGSILQILCGKANDSVLADNGLSDLSELIEESSRSYEASVEDARRGAEIAFEEVTARCTILYGSGLYGGNDDEYSMVFIFPDGTAQTVATQKLSSVRMSGGVLYYTLVAPDGLELQYGVNFGK